MTIRILLILVVIGFLSGISSPASSTTIPDKWIDAKYCGKPARDASGEIIRSQTAIKYFKLQNLCPSTMLTYGPCPDYEIDHPRPIARCGCDNPTNMIWLKKSIKSCAGTECKDRWELSAFQCKPEDR
jgi:hypothetical protein